ncbi:hypothetical protein A2Z33_06010 [Candidatus Gottesmanbacteria bacterium RBG_16_52_11]|uniref:Uncharacterized protein n=1 Tax=Candidatus Gottesmanbacteria bacterium RBG_16_52_11 TaxID=1798374 RepID=A0A1F5YXM9_9BACT|nr:MAG: hypothetical protein A2Z33_06010 [Candidatus Gottesmanbacteria bacterium RBG_16_52_11]
MIKDALSGLGKKPEDSEMLLVLGDRDEDSQLATNLGAVYIDVKGKSETQMTGEFGSYTGIGRKNRY